MKALVFIGTNQKEWKEQPRPTIVKSTDVIVRMHKTTICGTDLHILHGNVETVTPGRILGHEGIGFVSEIGKDVQRFQVGDKVLISCITSCGHCENCKIDFYGHCKDGGWQLGNTIDGCQAEYVRIPHGDFSLYHVPEDAEEDGFVMLSDVLPTGLEVGVLEGKVRAGCSVAVVGVGPIGLSSIISATAFSPSKIMAIDMDPNRLQVACELGATHSINNSDGSAVDQIMQLTHGKGVDVAIEAIGTPIGWDICENIVAAGGNIAILGVHGKSVTLHLERMWKRNFTLTAGLVHTSSIPTLMDRVMSGAINPKLLINQAFKLSEMERAYEVFGNASKYKALKVLIENDIS